MHVVFVCQVFYPDTQSTSQLFTDLFRGLDGQLNRITAVTGYTARSKEKRLKGQEFLGRIEIRRSGLQSDFKRSLRRRAFHYLFYVLGSTWHLWKLRKAGLVVGVTNPPFTPVWLWLLSKLFLRQYQVMLLDVFPDGLVALGQMKERELLTRLWRAANTRALQRADRVIVLGRDMQELVERRYGVDGAKVYYVPHWSSFCAPPPVPAEKTLLHQKLGLKEQFIVQYSGNMGLWHDLETIVRAAGRLQQHGDIRFLMIGDGMRRGAAQRLAEQLGLRNMTWLPFQPKDSLDDSLACCHLAMISQREGLKGIAVPCKLYGILAAGRGILAQVPSGSEVDMVVNEEACGMTIPPGDADALAAAIMRLNKDRQRVATMGENAFRAYQAKYTLDVAVETFKNIWKIGKASEPAAA